MDENGEGIETYSFAASSAPTIEKEEEPDTSLASTKTRTYPVVPLIFSTRLFPTTVADPKVESS